MAIDRVIWRSEEAPLPGNQSHITNRRAQFVAGSQWERSHRRCGARAPQPLPNNFIQAEWITLHDNSNFRGFVDFLRAEVDRVGPAQADLCRDFFCRAVALELFFFNAAYTT
jgi:thiaminase